LPERHLGKNIPLNKGWGGMLALFFAAAVAAVAPPDKDGANIEISGVASGPSRGFVDLDSGNLYVAFPPNGVPAGDNGSAKALPISVLVCLPGAEAARLRALADGVVAAGVEAPKGCQPSVNRIIQFEMNWHGHSISESVLCPSKQTEAFIGALYAAAAAQGARSR